MKTLISFSALAVLLFAIGCSAQSRTNRLYRPCPGSSTPAVVEVQKDGDINLVPCAGRTFQVNGVTPLGGLTVSGTTKTDFFPVWSAETNLAKSPFSWSSGVYNFQNATLDAAWAVDITPDDGTATKGSFAAGNQFANAFFLVDNENSLIRLIAGSRTRIQMLNSASSISIGDTQGNGNGNYFTITDSLNSFNFNSNGANPTFGLSTINSFIFKKTITTAGTTGNVTIDKPAGTVNIAAGAGAAGVTVTNSTVGVSSIVLAIARTNDATCSVKNVVPAAGSFILRTDANCTAETSFGFFVIN